MLILLVRDEVQLIEAVLVAKRGIQLTAGRPNRLAGGKCGLGCQRPCEIRMQANEAVGHGRCLTARNTYYRSMTGARLKHRGKATRVSECYVEECSRPGPAVEPWV